MFSSPTFYEVGKCSDYCEDDPSSDQNPKLSPRSMAEAKAVAASQSHKEAERRRRKRINAHIATLKSILPSNIKADKASLLGEAVRLVRELKKTTAELTSSDEDKNDDSNNTTLKVMFPSETDELKLCRCDNSGLIKVMFSCDDRPDIILDLIQALKSVEAKVVRAEMSTIGERTKTVLWVKLVSTSAAGSECTDVGLGTLRRALKMVMEKSTLSPGTVQGLPANKRPRYHHF